MDQVEQKLMLASSHEKIRLYHLSTRGYIHHLLNNGPGAGNVHTFVFIGFSTEIHATCGSIKTDMSFFCRNS
jgi:hypothetical protein